VASLRKKLAAASGVPGSITVACFFMASSTSGEVKALANASCTRLTSAGGMPAGPTTANQPATL
jgi:hypothetical protein